MSDVIRIERREIAKFDPLKTKERTSVYDAAIRHAQCMRDWIALRKAVDLQIKEQRAFVAWWRKHVRGAGQPEKNCRSTETILFISADSATKVTGIPKQKVSRWESRLSNLDAYREALFGPSYKKSWADEAGLLVQQSISNEHYTPAKYIEAARLVLGAIDLDPASCAEANEIVQAKEFFGLRNDGLAQEWTGRVWLNPPYGRDPGPGPFVTKLISHFQNHQVEAAVLLVNAHCTDTEWFQGLWDGHLCFTDHRINFSGDDARSGSTHGSVFVYFGKNKSEFTKQFSQFGAVVARIT